MTLSYSVTREFYGTNAISGSVRRFRLGDTLLCDTKAGGDDATVAFEIDSSFFLVERSIFKTCCVFKNEGAPL